MNVDVQIGRGAYKDTAVSRVSACPVFAALDLGTNNCRLLVVRPDTRARSGFRVVDAFSRIVRLGEGLSQGSRLCEAAMARAVAALRICRNKMVKCGVTAARAVATEACRRAVNRDEFLHRVKQEAGLDLDVISAEEKARLALAGCASLLDPSFPRALVFDIGGGSTEIMWTEIGGAHGFRLLDQLSLPLGVVDLTELFGGDRLAPGTYLAMVEAVKRELAPFEARNQIRTAVAAGQVLMLGTSGTVTTLAGIHLGLPRYDRSRVDGTYLEIDHARAVTRRLVDLNAAERAAFPCIGRERADLVVAGCAVLEAICETWPVPRVRIADRGLREGILIDLMEAAGK